VPPRLVHTGQHHGEAMSGVFFRELGLPEPDVHLGVGSGTHAEAVARVRVPLERELERNRPGLVSVVGDVHGTLAAALVAARAGVLLAHVEAGLHSFDRGMPEELNRVLRGEGKRGRVPDLWDGRAAERVGDVYARLLGGEARRARG